MRPGTVLGIAVPVLGLAFAGCGRRPDPPRAPAPGDLRAVLLDPYARSDLAERLRDEGPAGAARLLPLLEDPDASVRAAAAGFLGTLAAREATPALVQALGDPAAAVRAEAIGALEAMGPLAPGDRLAAALGDPDPRVRRRAAAAVGRTAPPGAARLLLARLGDAEPAVRYSVARALGDLRAPEAGLALAAHILDRNEHPGVRIAAVRALGRTCDERTLRTLRIGVLDPDADVAAEAAKQLGRLGDVPPEDLPPRLERSPADARVADRILRFFFGERDSLPAPLSDGAAAGARRAARSAWEAFLRERAAETAEARILRRIERGTAESLPDDLRALGLRGGLASLRPLYDASNQDDPEVQTAALDAMAGVGAREEPARRAWLASSAEPSDRMAAYLGAGQAGADPPDPAAGLGDPSPEVRRAALHARIRAGAPPAAWLDRAVRDPDPRVRLRALEWCERTDSGEARQALRGFLSDPEIGVAVRAAAALGAGGRPGDLDALLTALDTADYNVGGAILAALSIGWRDPRVAAAYRRVFDAPDGDPEHRALAARRLAALADPADDARLRGGISDADDRVTIACAEAAGTRKDAASIPALRKALGGEALWVREAVLHALGRIAHPETAPDIRPFLGSPETVLRAAAAEALGGTGDAADAGRLAPLVSDLEAAVRIAACEALRRLPRDRAAVRALGRALRDRDPRVRRAAGAALAGG